LPVRVAAGYNFRRLIQLWLRLLWCQVCPFSRSSLVASYRIKPNRNTKIKRHRVQNANGAQPFEAEKILAASSCPKAAVDPTNTAAYQQ
jgi:hypothetical protein